MNINSFDKLGQAGAAMMQDSVNRAAAVAESVSSGGMDVMDIAKSSVELSRAKVQMAMGAFLIRTQEELMNSTLQLFGVAINCVSTATLQHSSFPIIIIFIAFHRGGHFILSGKHKGSPLQPNVY